MSAWESPHSPKLSWEQRRAERLPFVEKAKAWRLAAIADGWTSEPTYLGHEPEEHAFRLRKNGFQVQGLARPGSDLLPTGKIYCWGPDGLTIRVGETYDWSAIQAGVETCMYCDAHPVKTRRVGFAGRACETCAPVEEKKLGPRYYD